MIGSALARDEWTCWHVTSGRRISVRVGTCAKRAADVKSGVRHARALCEVRVVARCAGVGRMSVTCKNMLHAHAHADMHMHMHMQYVYEVDDVTFLFRVRHKSLR